MKKKKRVEKTYNLKIEDTKGKKYIIGNVKEYATDATRGILYYREKGWLKYVHFRKIKIFENVFNA